MDEDELYEGEEETRVRRKLPRTLYWIRPVLAEGLMRSGGAQIGTELYYMTVTVP